MGGLEEAAVNFSFKVRQGSQQGSEGKLRADAPADNVQNTRKAKAGILSNEVVMVCKRQVLIQILKVLLHLDG